MEASCASPLPAGAPPEEPALLQAGGAFLLQLGTNLTRLDHSALEGMVAGTTRGSPFCTDKAGAVKSMLGWSIPLAVILVVFLWSLSAWAASARRLSLSDFVLGKVGGADSAGKKDGEDLDVPRVVFLFLIFGRLFLNVNFTIIMPASAEVMLKAGGTVFLSGLAIGIYAAGSILCTPIAVHLSRESYRVGLILTGIVTVFGNVAYAMAGSSHGPGAVAGLLLARMLCGCQSAVGSLFMNANQTMGRGAGIARLTAAQNFAVTFGLVIGPSVASLCRFLAPGLPPALMPSALMALVGLLYAAAAAAFFPYQRDLPMLEKDGLSSKGGSVQGTQEEGMIEEAHVRECWLCLANVAVIQCACLCQRVLWEAGALTVLMGPYGLSQASSGLLVGLPVLVSLPLTLAGPLLHRMGVSRSLLGLALLELIGLMMMFTFGRRRSLSLFLLGSSIFYSANWLTIVPMVQLRVGFNIKSHWALNTESFSGIVSLSMSAGTFLGPVLSRAVLSACASQNLLTGASLILWLGIFLSTEVAREVLLLAKASAK